VSTDTGHGSVPCRLYARVQGDGAFWGNEGTGWPKQMGQPCMHRGSFCPETTDITSTQLSLATACHVTTRGLYNSCRVGLAELVGEPAEIRLNRSVPSPCSTSCLWINCLVPGVPSTVSDGAVIVRSTGAEFRVSVLFLSFPICEDEKSSHPRASPRNPGFCVRSHQPLPPRLRPCSGHGPMSQVTVCPGRAWVPGGPMSR
jgi:hypothetical protein